MTDKKNSANMRINNEKGYKIVADNLGEYSIFRADDTIVSTEIQDKIFAESVLDELNTLHEENQTLRKLLKIRNTNAKDLLDVLNAQEQYKVENQQLKAQLLCDEDEGVCNICKHQYLIESGKYCIAKCEKEHGECSRVSLRYCEDFELVSDYDDG